MDDQYEKVQSILHSLALQGITISICYGLCGDKGILYSVDVLTFEGESFEKPFAASSLMKSAEIALKECTERGWYEEVIT